MSTDNDGVEYRLDRINENLETLIGIMRDNDDQADFRHNALMDILKRIRSDTSDIGS